MEPATISPDAAASWLARTLADRAPAHSLPGRLYHDASVLTLEHEHLWHREWVFAGHACELSAPGAFLTLVVGAYPVVVLRGDDGVLRALHNVCRHRGSIVCDEVSGTARHRLVCPYHQWSYALDGRLARARGMPDGFDLGGHALGAAHVADVGGLVFVCVAGEPPPIEPLRQLVEPYLLPFDLARARVAHSETMVEHGNWKLVLENNRECHHCRTAHPELCTTFPEGPLHSGGGDDTDVRRMAELVERCEADGLPSRFARSADHQYRAMRMPFVGSASSMTRDGAPAVARRFGRVPDYNIGDVLLYHYPSTWNHVMADHAVTFRVLPTGPTTTELRTTWLVPADAVDGVDYHRHALTEVWLATNAQDRALVERAQRGVASPAYRPGPYAPLDEEGVVQFVDWYAGVLGARLAERGT